MSTTTHYDDNFDVPLKYAPKWIRDAAEPQISASDQVNAGTTDQISSLPLRRGLDELIGVIEQERIALQRAHQQRRVAIEFLRPNARNPRRDYSDAEFDELTESIREHGILQPILVRANRELKDSYEILAGERRWRAARRAGLEEVPIVLLDVSDSEALEIAIIENVQRADLSPVEEAAGYQVLADEFGRNQEEIAKIIGKSRSYIANTLRLLKLPDKVKEYIHAGKLTAGHARLLVAQPDAQGLAEKIIDQGLNVRQVEALVQERASDAGKRPRTHTRAHKGADALALEKRLSGVLGLSVSIGRSDRGILFVRYRNLEQLQEVLFRLEARHHNGCPDFTSPD